MAQSKSEAAARRIKDINPSIAVNPHSQFLNTHNGLDLLNQPDVTVDCLDNVSTRFVVERLCKQIGSLLRNKLLVADLNDGIFDVMNLI